MATSSCTKHTQSDMGKLEVWHSIVVYNWTHTASYTSNAITTWSRIPTRQLRQTLICMLNIRTSAWLTESYKKFSISFALKRRQSHDAGKVVPIRWIFLLQLTTFRYVRKQDLTYETWLSDEGAFPYLFYWE